MIRLDAATFFLQWATGGLLFLWVTTRGRLVGLGYGWLLRGVYATIAVGAVLSAMVTRTVVVRDVAAACVVVAALGALAVSVIRKGAGVSGQLLEAERKRTRVAAMAGSPDLGTASTTMRDQFGRVVTDAERVVRADRPEFPPTLDLLAPAIGLVGLVAGAWSAGGNHALAIARIVVGALFLGAVSDAMLLGHWYLVQPGLPRAPIHELNNWLLRIWPVEVALLLVPPGMVSAITGSVDDGWNGMLTWFWVASALATGVLAWVTRIALRERFYSAVMAATGFLYLAILMAFVTDLVARAILS